MFNLSAGTYIEEYDTTAGISPQSTSIACSVLVSPIGDIGPKMINSVTQFDSIYGTSTPAHLSIRRFLTRGNQLWIRRVINGALWAGTTYYTDSQLKRVLAVPFKLGSPTDYSGDQVQFQTLELSGPLVAGNSITLNVSNGFSTTTVTQSFTVDNNTTLNNLATQINTVISGYGDGSVVAYQEWLGPPLNETYVLSFNSPLVAGDKFGLTITNSNGVQVVIPPVSYTTNNDTTLTAIATAIATLTPLAATKIPGSTTNSASQIYINSLTPGQNIFTIGSFTGSAALKGSVQLIQQGTGVNDNRIISIVSPQLTDIIISNISVTGAGAPALINSTNNKIFDVFAKCAGEYASNTGAEQIGVQISGLDQGVQDRYLITFSDMLEVGAVFGMTIGDNNGNNWNITVPYTVNNDTTLTAIAAAIQSTLNTNIAVGGNSTVVIIDGSIGSNNRQIIVIAPLPGKQLILTNCIVNNSYNNPNVLVQHTLYGILPSGIFTLSVYTLGNGVNNPVKTWKVSLIRQLDRNGQQLYIEDVINNDNSNLITVKVNESNTVPTIYGSDANINWLGGGDDGMVPTTSQIINAWQDFADPEKITVRILINAGYTAIPVQQAMDDICNKRRDCFAILDMPSDQQATSVLAMNYRKFTLNIDSSYSAIYTPDLLVFDPTTNQSIYIPPSGFIAAQFAYNDEVAAEWFAPAGLNRGIISGVLGVRTKYNEADRDLMEPNQINSIRFIPGPGHVVIWGAETLQVKPSVLSNINVRRLLITVETTVVDSMNYELWEPNDPITWINATDKVNSILAPIYNSRGLTYYNVQCNAITNSQDKVIRGIMEMNVYIVPTVPAKEIKVNMILAASSAVVSELISAGPSALNAA